MSQFQLADIAPCPKCDNLGCFGLVGIEISGVRYLEYYCQVRVEQHNPVTSSPRLSLSAMLK